MKTPPGIEAAEGWHLNDGLLGAHPGIAHFYGL
jgi:hypothetical protein